MINLDDLDLRTLQRECSKAVMVFGGDNHTLSKFNKQGRHNSHNWYKAVISSYIEQYGDLPSNAGPGQNIKTVM